MKIKTKYFVFLTATLVASLGLFVGLTLHSYTQDKISFIKEKIYQNVSSIAQNISDSFHTTDGNMDLSLVYSDKVQNQFSKEDISDRFLLNKEGLILAGDAKYRGRSFHDDVSEKTLEKINFSTTAAGLIETFDNKGKKIIVAYSGVPDTEYFVIQSYPYDSINRFLRLFLIKVFFAFLSIGSFFVLLGYVIVNRFTKSLDDLGQSADKFGAGDFKHRILVSGRDEVASLADHFNKMAKKIESSLQLEGEKARLQLEMETAQKIQETLFLPSLYKKDGFEVAGYYQPASECGGDWWYYFEKDNCLWVCIGDVTGHGVGSAMLVSSVRAAMTLIAKNETLTPAKLLTKLNQVICESLGGKLQMTFCVLQISLSDKRITYANASHEFPFYLKRKEPLSKKDIGVLAEALGPRLGQDIESQYSDTSVQVSPGSRLLLFSDGIYDVENKDKKPFGERQFVKTVLQASQANNTANGAISEIISVAQKYRSGSPLKDDISIVCVDID